MLAAYGSIALNKFTVQAAYGGAFAIVLRKDFR
jgi:hypothetical protein